MTTWTVITRLDRDGMHDYYGAIPGTVEVHGDDVHAARINADTANTALSTIIEAFRTVGPQLVSANSSDRIHANRWTVIGTTDPHEPGYPYLTAVLAGEHTVQGHRDPMLPPRWATVVDATSPEGAYEQAMEVARRQYKAALALN